MTEILATHTKSASQLDGLDEMNKISHDLSENIGIYRHCEYQSMIAAAIVSQVKDFVVATVPTGSGKTWIQGLVAKYFCLRG